MSEHVLADSRKASGRGGMILLGLLALLGPGLYAAGLAVAALIDDRPWTEVLCFDPGLSQHAEPARAAAAVAMALGSVVLLWVIPWLLGTVALTKAVVTRRAIAAFSPHVWSLVANTAALFVTGLVLRATVGIDRASFLAAWGTWIVALLVLAGRPAAVAEQLISMARRRGILAAIALGAVVLGIVVFFPEHFLQCFNGDGTEFDELARSLRHHALPYWEIEPTGQFGTFVANPTVTNSYWTLGLQVLLGPGELATRLPYWVWWLGIILVAGAMAGGEVRNSLTVYLPLALVVFLISVWYTFYVGYDPYAADLANPGVPDALFTLLVLLGLDCLRREDPWGWAAAMVAASLLFYAGVVMLGLSAAAAMVWQPVPRRAMLRAALAAAAILSGVAILYLILGWCNGSMAAWVACLRMEWVDKYFAPEPRGWPGLLFLGYFALGCGGLPIVGLPAAFCRGPWQRTVATVVLAYLAIILGSGLKNIHYLGPLLPLPLVLWLDVGWAKRSDGPPKNVGHIMMGRRCAWPTLLVLSIAVCLWLCWPVERPLFTLNRMLGQLTVFEAGSYEEACRLAEVSEQLYDEGRLGWQIGRHTWVGYGRIDPEGRALTLGVCRHKPPGDWQLLTVSPQGYGVYCNDGRLGEFLARQRPREAKDRFARVFRPIAPKVKPLAGSRE